MDKREEYTILGLMSGTSMDGLDMAMIKFIVDENQPPKAEKYQYQILASKTIPYNENTKSILKNLTATTAVELIKANNWFAAISAHFINNFITQTAVKPDYIASHGHTVFHNPAENYTLQIGSGAVLYAHTQIPVVCDFRTVDVALGGQGAPLVPIGDAILFSNYNYCLNLGGIANISFEEKNQRIAYDICPINIVLNALCAQLSPPLPYDDKGNTAMSGKVITNLLGELECLAFYSLPYPKSLGIEWINNHFFPVLNKYESENKADLLCTCCHHFAKQIALAINNKNNSSSNLLVTGGGAYNEFLIQLLKEYISSRVEIIVPDNSTIDFKEALIFAFLGLLRIRGKKNALRSVTGASIDSIGGAIYGD